MPFSRSITFTAYFLLFLFPTVLFSQKEKADSLVRELSFKKDIARIPLLIELSNAFLEFSRTKAMDAALEARTIAFQNANEDWEAKSLVEVANVQVRNGNFDDAIETLNQASKIFLQSGKKSEYVSCLNSISEYYHNKGDFNSALEKSLDAYKYAETNANKNGMARALLNSGRVYESMQNFNKSITDLQRALEMCHELGDKKTETIAINDISNVYEDKGEYEKAIEFLLKGLDIAKQISDEYSVAVNLNNLSAVYINIGQELDSLNTSQENKEKARSNYDKALEYANQSYEIRKKIGDKKGMVSCLTNIGNVWYLKGDIGKSIQFYKQAFEIASEIGLGESELTILYNISEAYHTNDQNDSAFIYARKYSDLNDTIFHQNLADKISEMQAKYGVEKAEGDARATEQEKKLITIAASIGGVLSLIIVIVLWNRAVTRKRTNIKLNQQKTEIELKNSALHSANVEIELKNKDITDSIQYARRIQEAILPEVEFQSTFGDSAFVLYRPKDIVSGDLYWMAQTGDYLLFAAVDCTGHGVPGAFVSIVCSNLLSQAVKEHGLVQPSQILNDVNIRLSETLRQRQDTSRVRDGMDIALCSLNKKTLHLTYAGAFNPAWIFRENEFIELAPDKFPVGLFEEEELRKFSFKEIQLSRGDRIYIFSDGYSDQFGGALGKKYKRSVFCDFVKNMQHESIKTQGKLLEEEHLKWKGENEQIDDILVIGLEV